MYIRIYYVENGTVGMTELDKRVWLIPATNNGNCKGMLSKKPICCAYN